MELSRTNQLRSYRSKLKYTTCIQWLAKASLSRAREEGQPQRPALHLQRPTTFQLD